MIKIGDRELVFSETITVADDQEVRIDTVVGGEEVKLTIRFTNDAAADDGFAQWAFDGTRLQMTFKNWKQVGGRIFTNPQHIGTFGGKPLGFHVSHAKFANMNLVNFQLLYGP